MSLRRRQLRVRMPVERDPKAPDVFPVLVDNHARSLAFLERRVGSLDVAEDILQEAFVRSLGRADSIRNPDSAVAWFHRLLRNAIADPFGRQEVRDWTLTRFCEEAAAADEELEAVVCACVSAGVRTVDGGECGRLALEPTTYAKLESSRRASGGCFSFGDT